jgi:hypothetical protein
MTSPATNVRPSVGARIVAVGSVPTLIVSGVEIVVLIPSETDKRTLYGPAVGYVCVGFAAVDVVPSPNAQL